MEDTNIPAKEKRPLISFKDAAIINGESIVIYDLNMDVYSGDFVYIVGKVGTGKLLSSKQSLPKILLKKERRKSADTTSKQ